jgi:hypothetical protein
VDSGSQNLGAIDEEYLVNDGTSYRKHYRLMLGNEREVNSAVKDADGAPGGPPHPESFRNSPIKIVSVHVEKVGPFPQF